LAVTWAKPLPNASHRLRFPRLPQQRTIVPEVLQDDFISVEIDRGLPHSNVTHIPWLPQPTEKPQAITNRRALAVISERWDVALRPPPAYVKDDALELRQPRENPGVEDMP